ncbi:MAG: TIGR01777 family oxidoreductase [Planctomycetota bacterium]
MRIAVTGATGFVGRNLVARLREKGHEVRALVRDLGRAEDALGSQAELRLYDPYDLNDVRDALDGIDGVVNLAGENIFGARWTKAVKKSLRDSRVVTTRAFYDALHSVPLEERPKVFVSASAVGYYGARPAGTACPEDEHAATQLNAPDFLGHLCEEWEAAAQRLRLLGVRVVTPRIGVVLGRGGGALQQMEPVARLHVSVQIGNGRQMVSWVHMDDLVSILVYALETPDLKGAVNATAPEPVTNRQLAKSLAKAMGKKALAPGMPAPVAKMVFGKGRAGMLLEGQEVKPYVLQDRGFRFRFPDIASALADIYGG